MLLSDGSRIQYGKLISTLPLDLVLPMVGREDLARRLTKSASHIVGIGLRGVTPHDTKVWGDGGVWWGFDCVSV